jgi:hypothetical protein
MIAVVYHSNYFISWHQKSRPFSIFWRGEELTACSPPCNAMHPNSNISQIVSRSQDLIISQRCCPDVVGRDGTEQDVLVLFGAWDTVSLLLYSA